MNIRITLLTLIILFSCGEDRHNKTKSLHEPKKTELKEVFEPNEYENDTLRAQDVDDLTEVSNTDLEEANKYFTFRSLPINPRVLMQFIPWISDSRPSIMSIDLLSANHGTNQFGDSDALKKREDGSVDVDFERGKIGYKWIGKLNNNVHLLKFYESGGGSGVFSSLIFVKFEIRDFVNDSKKYKQLLITCLRHNGLSDRAKTDIKLDKQNNRVYVSNQPYWSENPEKFVVEF